MGRKRERGREGERGKGQREQRGCTVSYRSPPVSFPGASNGIGHGVIRHPLVFMGAHTFARVCLAMCGNSRNSLA